ncbi:MAG: ABC transporter transmembrane domain-containing protein, partial [Bacteroidia bacterium]
VLIFLIIFAVFASGVLQIIQLWIMELIQQRIFARASFDFIGKVTALKSKIIKQQYPPELMNRFFDIVAIQKSLSSILIDFSASAIQIIFGLTLLALYHPVFIAFSLVLALVIYLMIKYTGNKGLESSLKESKYKYNIVSWLQQVASARETFRLQTSKNLPVQKMDEYVSHYLTARKKHFRILITQYMYFLGFSVLITGGLLIAGYFLLMSKSITLGQLVASEIIILLIVNSIEKLIHKIESIYDILTSVEKVSQVLTMEVEVQKQELRINLSSDNLLTIEGLKLANEQDIISFNIKSGEIKNIYLNDRLNLNAFTEILLKEVDYTGSIKLNSIELNKLKSAFIQNNLALYTNQEKLFDGTIRENICFDNHQDNDELLLNLISFFGFEQIINDLSSGLNTEIVGGNYSWGNNFQRQLILLRSFFKKPKLLIIDELLLPKHVELIKLKKYINSALPNSMVIIISKEIIDEEVK